MEEEQEQQPEWAVGPEDEYDALNDETFGDVGEGGLTIQKIKIQAFVDDAQRHLCTCTG